MLDTVVFSAKTIFNSKNYFQQQIVALRKSHLKIIKSSSQLSQTLVLGGKVEFLRPHTMKHFLGQK